MKIAYCTNVRLPTERAHGHQVASVCDALVSLGHEVTVVSPYRTDAAGKDFHAYYGVSRDIRIAHLGKTDPLSWMLVPEFIGFRIMNYFFRNLLRAFLAGTVFDVLYTRSPVLLPTLLATGVPVILECHALPRSLSAAFVRDCNRCEKIVCLTSLQKQELVAHGVDEARILVEGDAVDIEQFSGVSPDPALRLSLGIPSDAPVLGYVGQLESMGLSKGIPELLAAFALLAARNPHVHLMIVGGPAQSAERFRKTVDSLVSPQVHFCGIIPHEKVPAYMADCTLLVYPAPASDHVFYNRDTSPMKLFEYMAAGRPVICADLPPLHDVVGPEDVLFVPPGNAAAIADAAEMLLAKPEAASALASKAYATVGRYTWKKRMARIVESLSGALNVPRAVRGSASTNR